MENTLQITRPTVDSNPIMKDNTSMCFVCLLIPVTFYVIYLLRLVAI